MRLSCSNIAWQQEQDGTVYALMRDMGFTGLEIAPTRFFPDRPYDCTAQMTEKSAELLKDYGLRVVSMQSILYGRKECLFDPDQAELLLKYLEQAFSFGEAAGGCNFVFGCPKNRIMPDGCTEKDALPFFERAAESAGKHGCVLSVEANPPMYGTNFLNTTKEAFSFARKVPGLKVNLDFGTIVNQCENLKTVAANSDMIGHVHISEPGLVSVICRQEHRELAELLREQDYDGYVSVEMKQTDTDTIRSVLSYVSEVFR